jgi:drug/metabolite transporter (DMT)-like permease
MEKVVDAHIGQVAALATALCWTVTAMAFESAGKRVGSLPVNLLRLLMAIVFLSLYSLVMRGRLFPTDASAHAWLWLSVSGIIGFLLGDILLFRAFVVIGSRISMLIMAAVPPITAVLGWMIMGERLSFTNLVGMGLTIAGISWVVLERGRGEADAASGSPGSRRLTGILLAFGGAFGQAVGLVLSKYGMGDYDAFAATQIRIIAGAIGFVLLFFIRPTWRRVGAALRDGAAMQRITLGAFFGPFLGVSLSLLAVQYTESGVAATIMSIVPVLIIVPAIIVFKERPTKREVVGAVVAVVGVAVMFL